MHEELRRVRTWVGATKQLRLQVRNADGTAADLSGYASATVSANNGATAKIASATVTIESAGSTGYVNFTPDSADIDEAGDYLAQIRFVDGSGNVDYTDKFVIEVATPIYNV